MQRWSKLRRNKCLNHLHLWGTEPLVREAQPHSSENGGTPPTVALVKHSMKNRQSVVAESFALKNNEGNNRRGGMDDTYDHGLYVQMLESRGVPKK